ncbi:hypothetical protein [Kamptonema formosum]|uniref:hypothetical protein n=1 Tax=Kamptonema formosum TaxID=331992 RepID=UPI00034B50D3|nr:hypothetical protein [Oscillatoria sp. PCC 10802]
MKVPLFATKLSAIASLPSLVSASEKAVAQGAKAIDTGLCTLVYLALFPIVALPLGLLALLTGEESED